MKPQAKKQKEKDADNIRKVPLNHSFNGFEN